jgi:hypothetical protein
LGAAHAGPDEHARRFAIASIKEGPGISYGLGRRHESELTDTIQHAEPRWTEVGCAIERHRRSDTAFQARM